MKLLTALFGAMMLGAVATPPATLAAPDFELVIAEGHRDGHDHR